MNIREAFNFEVEKRPLSGPNGEQTGYYGLFKGDKIVGKSSVSESYVLHTTDDVIVLAECAEKVFGQCETECRFNDAHYVTCAPTKDYRKSIFGDGVWPRLIIEGGYDKTPFSVSLGYYRDLCKNMSILRSVGECHVTLRHTHSLRSKMDELIDMFQGLENSWTVLTARMQELKDKKVNLVEFLKEMYGEKPKEEGSAQTRFLKKMRAIANRIASERKAIGQPISQEVNGWEMFNAIQGYVQHEQSRRGKVTQFDRIILASNDAQVKRAEGILVA